jgi:magnesium transporter
MNFTNMPELQWRWGYYMVLSGMAALATVMLAFFKRRNWL